MSLVCLFPLLHHNQSVTNAIASYVQSSVESVGYRGEKSPLNVIELEYNSRHLVLCLLKSINSILRRPLKEKEREETSNY